MASCCRNTCTAGVRGISVLGWRMATEEDPVRVLREAWSIVRLGEIREFATRLIGQISRIRPEDLLGRPISTALGPAGMDPVQRALQTCSDQLRTESGLAGAEASLASIPDAGTPHAATEAGWNAVYQEALGKYRAEAGKSLRGWLDSFTASQCSKPSGE